MHHVSNLLFFSISLLYCYTNLNSSIIFCLSNGDIYLSFSISLLAYECNSLEYNSFGDFFECNSAETLACNFMRNFIAN